MPLADKKVLQNTTKNKSNFICYKNMFNVIQKNINKVQSFNA